ncbi:hypothetical protein ABZ896_12370 [Streptomyces sp. NPDC047072]|uniref:hypothetical protein n=1 Tax=Streptomyces sp. NPDC047072 TaxID=3154809 RepID=UPI00340A3841
MDAMTWAEHRSVGSPSLPAAESHRSGRCVYEGLQQIIELMAEVRRARAAATSSTPFLELFASLVTAVSAGEWRTVQESADALEHLYGDLGESGQHGLHTVAFPALSVETRLHKMLEAFGYPAQSVHRLLAAAEGTTPASPADVHQEALRAELQAFAHRNTHRDELLLESVAAEIPEAETARLSGLARGTVRAVRGRATDKTSAPWRGAAVPAQPRRQPVPTVPPTLFLAPE